MKTTRLLAIALTTATALAAAPAFADPPHQARRRMQAARTTAMRRRRAGRRRPGVVATACLGQKWTGATGWTTTRAMTCAIRVAANAGCASPTPSTCWWRSRPA